MIPYVTGHGSIQVVNNNSRPYVSNSGNPFTGMLRFNPSNSNYEVFDGTNWMVISSGGIDIRLSDETESLLNWAREKRNEERELKNLMEKYPGLRDAYEKFELMKILVSQDTQSDQKP